MKGGQFEKASSFEKIIIPTEFRKLECEIHTVICQGIYKKEKEKKVLNMQKTWGFILKGQEIAYKFLAVR